MRVCIDTFLKFVVWSLFDSIIVPKRSLFKQKIGPYLVTIGTISLEGLELSALLATCKLVSAEGSVIKEKLLQGQRIFGQAKKHVTKPAKFVDIVTISDDDNDETNIRPKRQQQHHMQDDM